MEILQASPVKPYEYFIDRIEISKIKLSVLNKQNGKKYIDYINTNDDIWINDLSNTFHKNFNKFFEFIELVFENKLNANIDTELSDNKLSLNINYEQGFMPINIKLILKEEKVIIIRILHILNNFQQNNLNKYRKTVSCDKMMSLDPFDDFEFTKLKDGVIKVYNEVKKVYGK